MSKIKSLIDNLEAKEKKNIRENFQKTFNVTHKVYYRRIKDQNPTLEVAYYFSRVFATPIEILYDLGSQFPYHSDRSIPKIGEKLRRAI